MTLSRLSLTLSPQATGIGVEYVPQAPSIPAGQAVCRLPAVVVGIPGAPLRSADLRVVDDLGDLPLREEDEPATPSFTYRRWCATRHTVSDVTVSYFAPVRVEPAPGHRVFIRKHPYPGNGGTALPRSFMFGWSAVQTPAPDDLADLLAHETAHNWPRLDGEHVATTVAA